MVVTDAGLEARRPARRLDTAHQACLREGAKPVVHALNRDSAQTLVRRVREIVDIVVARPGRECEEGKTHWRHAETGTPQVVGGVGGFLEHHGGG